MAMAGQQTPKTKAVRLATADCSVTVCSCAARSSAHAKWLVPCVLVRILLALVHLLLKRLGLLLVGKGEAGEALFQLKGVEEGAVLVVGEGVVDLLIPDDAAVGGRDIDHLDPEGVAD